MTEYKIEVDGQDKGTIMSDCLGNAARSALLNLNIQECERLYVLNTRRNIGCTYFDVYISQDGMMGYEYTA